MCLCSVSGVGELGEFFSFRLNCSDMLLLCGDCLYCITLLRNSKHASFVNCEGLKDMLW
jgi:hypothetical protein